MCVAIRLLVLPKLQFDGFREIFLGTESWEQTFIYANFKNLQIYTYNSGYAVAQLVEALRYKLEGRGFDSQWSYWNFSVT
jgi:hypothetical protein